MNYLAGSLHTVQTENKQLSSYASYAMSQYMQTFPKSYTRTITLSTIHLIVSLIVVNDIRTNIRLYADDTGLYLVCQ